MKDFLIKHAEKNPVSFHMPGHKGSRIYRKYGYSDFLERFMDMDVTEIPGADNLFQANGIIKDVEDRYAAAYGAEHSWLLAGGSSAGLIASILACVHDGERLVMARNCHKSVFNALRLAGGVPIYAYPETLEEYGISGAVTTGEIERCIKKAPDAKAVVVTSPNYYGICSDIESIARAVHEAGMILIVDQAHGAHLKFFGKYKTLNLPRAAEDQGADIVVSSMHKTMASMTQSAILDLCSGDHSDEGGVCAPAKREENMKSCLSAGNNNAEDREHFEADNKDDANDEPAIAPYIIDDKLQMIESSSPSYILMASLDIALRMMEEHGEELMRDWAENLIWFYEEAERIAGLEILNAPGMDRTKICIDMGFPAARLEKLLNERDIFPELCAGNLLMCMSGIGNVRSDYEKLIEALEEIAKLENCGVENPGAETGDAVKSKSKEEGGKAPRIEENDSPKGSKESRNKLPTPGRWRGFPKGGEWVPLKHAAGRVCAIQVTPYPPGIPMICPGEEITPVAVEYISELLADGETVMGTDNEGRIFAE